MPITRPPQPIRQLPAPSALLGRMFELIIDLDGQIICTKTQAGKLLDQVTLTRAADFQRFGQWTTDGDHHLYAESFAPSTRRAVIPSYRLRAHFLHFSALPLLSPSVTWYFNTRTGDSACSAVLLSVTSFNYVANTYPVMGKPVINIKCRTIDLIASVRDAALLLGQTQHANAASSLRSPSRR